MTLKIMHTGDIHLGMKFNQYANISHELEEARYQALENTIKEANKRHCSLFVVAGDLFDKTNIKDQSLIKTIDILDKFAGDVVLILPGNHDYQDGIIDLWQRFKQHLTGKMLLLDEEKTYDLKKFDIDAEVYPAPCDSKLSDSNNLGWLKDIELDNSSKYKIGLAHGALAGFSPDLTDSYFKMTEEELLELGLDIWLLGHSHIAYPEAEKVKNRKIYNSGTPEPDGMDCSHRGYAWYLEINEDKEISAERVITGSYHFEDLEQEIKSEADLKKILENISSSDPETKILRLKLTGNIPKELFLDKQKYIDQIRDKTFYAVIDQTELRMQIDKEMIAEEFSAGSFPYQLLNELADREEVLNTAYNLLKEVRDETN
jgi:DNA repair exonuclease SbcCD nuclease subunit